MWNSMKSHNPMHDEILRKNNISSTPCRNINKFGLLQGNQKILSGFYNGGLWENILKHN